MKSDPAIIATMLAFADEGHGSQKRGNVVSELGHSLQFLERYLR